MAVRPRVPLHPELSSDESIVSWIKRYATLLDCTESELVEHLIDTSDTRQFSRWHGAAAQPEHLDSIADRTGICVEKLVQATTAGRYPGLPAMTTVVERHQVGKTLRDHLPWTHLTGTRVCPRCVEETGQLKVWWQTKLAAVCPTHQTLLSETCPTCESRWNTNGRGESRTLSRLPNQPLSTCGRRGRTESCAQTTSTLAVVTAPPATIEAQEWLLRQIESPKPTIAGEEVTLIELGLAMQCIWQHAAGWGPLLGASELAHAGHRQIEHDGTTIGGAPASVAEASLAIETAHALLGAKGIETASDLARQSWNYENTWLDRNQRKRLAKPAALQPIWDATRHRQHRTQYLGIDHRNRTDIDPSCIPQMLPADLSAELVELGKPASELRTRMAASLIITKTATGEPWDSCADLLGYDNRISSAARFANDLLNPEDQKEVWRLLGIAADDLAGRSTNYRNREAEAGTFEAPTDEEWSGFKRPPGKRLPHEWRRWVPVMRWEQHASSPWTWSTHWPTHIRAAGEKYKRAKAGLQVAIQDSTCR